VTIALAVAHLSRLPGTAIVALVFSLRGLTIHLAQNTALPMPALSKDFDSATNSDSQRALVTGLGRPVLAIAVVGGPGTITWHLLVAMALNKEARNE
jgi:nitrate reductase NapE component